MSDQKPLGDRAVTPATLGQHPPRRPHKKSRTGCTTCKARKIKCDERRPACLNCISHGVECPFHASPGPPPVPTTAAAATTSRTRSAKPSPPALPPPTTTKSHAPSPLPPLTPAPTPNPSFPPPVCPSPDNSGSGSGSDELPLLELELLHNFSTLTYATLAADPGVCDFWRVTVVQIGLRCSYIMRSVLAISALHLAYHRPSQRDYYTAQGIELHRRAARSAMRYFVPDGAGIAHLDDAVSLFLFSMLTIYFALASPRRSLADGSFFIAAADGGSDAPSVGFPDWTFLMNGAKSLGSFLGSEGHTTVLAPFLAYGHGRWSAGRESMNAAGVCLVPALGELRRRIAAAVPLDQAGLVATYAHALDELELALSARQDEAAPRDVLDAMLWLWEVSDSLMPLLKPNLGSSVPQEAVAIFAHFGILLKHHEKEWWLQGWAEHLVSRAYEILDDEHRGWIEWPMREVGWAPVSDTLSRLLE